MNKQTIINVRVTKHEKQIIKEKAELNNMNISTYLRTLGLYANKIQVKTEIKLED